MDCLGTETGTNQGFLRSQTFEFDFTGLRDLLAFMAS